MEQLCLSFGHSENSLKKIFEQAAGREVTLTITDNATSMITVRPKREALCVRLNRIFLGAGMDG